MRLFLMGLVLVSFSAFATSWRDFEVGQEMKLKQDFQLQQNFERSSSYLNFTKGEALTLKEIFPLQGIGVIVYIFDYHSCPGPELKTDMEIIPVHGTSPVVEVGAQLEENCELNVYLEVRDLFSESLFE